MNTCILLLSNLVLSPEVVSTYMNDIITIFNKYIEKHKNGDFNTESISNDSKYIIN